MSPEPRTPVFDTIEQERDHWKDKYDEVRDMLEEAKMEVGESRRVAIETRRYWRERRMR